MVGMCELRIAFDEIKRVRARVIQQRSNRGWIIADARLNTKVDDEVRNTIFTKMTYHYDASDAKISIFSWDNISPEPPKMFFVGFSEERTREIEYGLYRTLLDSDSSSILSLDCEGIDSPREAQCVVNQHVIAVSPGNSDKREEIQVRIPDAYFTTGENSVLFRYTPSPDERRKGYALYGIKVQVPATTQLTAE